MFFQLFLGGRTLNRMPCSSAGGQADSALAWGPELARFQNQLETPADVTASQLLHIILTLAKLKVLSGLVMKNTPTPSHCQLLLCAQEATPTLLPPFPSLLPQRMGPASPPAPAPRLLPW